MPAYNFKAEFAEAVESGKKRQTIRLRRKRPTKVGDRLYLYSGMRTKRCRKLREATCRCVKPVDIFRGTIRLGGRFLGLAEQVDFVEMDGFESEADFFRFFEALGLPVVGTLELLMW